MFPAPSIGGPLASPQSGTAPGLKEPSAVDHGANRHRPYGPLPMSNHGQVVEAVGADSATNPACDLASQLPLQQTGRPASARRKKASGWKWNAALPPKCPDLRRVPSCLILMREDSTAQVAALWSRQSGSKDRTSLKFTQSKNTSWYLLVNPSRIAPRLTCFDQRMVRPCPWPESPSSAARGTWTMRCWSGRVTFDLSCV